MCDINQKFTENIPLIYEISESIVKPLHACYQLVNCKKQNSWIGHNFYKNRSTVIKVKLDPQIASQSIMEGRTENKVEQTDREETYMYTPTVS